MSKPNKKNKLIKPLEGYTAMSDDDVVSRGTAVVTGLTGNTHFTTLPVDLVTLKANVDCFPAPRGPGGLSFVAPGNILWDSVRLSSSKCKRNQCCSWFDRLTSNGT